MIPHQSLSQVLSLVRKAVAGISQDGYWITAELLKISNGYHRYLELVEYDVNRKEIAKSQGMIWNNKVTILADFEKSTGTSLVAGMKILFHARPVFSEVYGLTLEVDAIDPTYTLGDMQAKVRMIRKYLSQQGWLNKNRSMPIPGDFTRVAVIAPADGAGLGDFRSEADHLASHGLCSFDYFYATFQGANAPTSIVDQMIKVHKTMSSKAYDCLIIIRGGGDKAGLYHLNDKRLAVAVCRFPAPVFVGIGHERDKVFLEEIACRNFPTPSLLVSHMKQQVVRNAEQAAANYIRLAGLANARLEKIQHGISELYYSLREDALKVADSAERKAESLMDNAVASASHQLNMLEKDAEQKKRDLFATADVVLERAEHTSNLMVSSVMSSNPLAVLGKGYAYVQCRGKVITKTSQLNAGDRIVTCLKDFSIHSTVEVTHEH